MASRASVTCSTADHFSQPGPLTPAAQVLVLTGLAPGKECGARPHNGVLQPFLCRLKNRPLFLYAPSRVFYDPRTPRRPLLLLVLIASSVHLAHRCSARGPFASSCRNTTAHLALALHNGSIPVTRLHPSRCRLRLPVECEVGTVAGFVPKTVHALIIIRRRDWSTL
jgi:hypothetical protein